MIYKLLTFDKKKKKSRTAEHIKHHGSKTAAKQHIQRTMTKHCRGKQTTKLKLSQQQARKAPPERTCQTKEPKQKPINCKSEQGSRNATTEQQGLRKLYRRRTGQLSRASI
jgi:hypothetical protein